MKDILGFNLLIPEDLGAIVCGKVGYRFIIEDGSLDSDIENYSRINAIINNHPYGCFFSCKREGDTKWLPARPILNVVNKQIEGYLIFDEDGDGYHFSGSSWLTNLNYVGITLGPTE